MGKIIGVITLLIMSFAYGPACAGEAQPPVINACALGEMDLKFRGNEDQRVYLGVPAQENLCLCRIPAERLIIVIFNAFCSVCQADARALNALYQTIEDDQSLKGRTKVVGIATGNTETEVEHYQIKHGVPYPIFADPEFMLDKAIPQNLRTPLLVTARVLADKRLEVIGMHMGAVTNVEELLTEPAPQAASDPGVRVASAKPHAH